MKTHNDTNDTELDHDESAKTERLLTADVTSNTSHKRHRNGAGAAMYRISFRQFNVHGCLSNTEDEIVFSQPHSVKSHRSREEELTTLKSKTDTLQPFRWYLTIQNDDVKEYDTIMNGFSDCKLSLIQGKFIYQADMHLSKIAEELKAHCTFETSFILACAFGSKEIVQRMINDGVDVRVRERSGNNFVHALIQATAENRDREGMFVDMYHLVMDQVPVKTKKELLCAEDKNCYRPVELAVLRGAYGIFKAIFETEGAYKDAQPSGKLGIHTFFRYNISEYENFESRHRELRSPLRLMTFIHYSHLKSYVKFDVHSMPVIKSWRDKQIKSTLPTIVIWYIFKVIFITAVLLLDSSRLSVVRDRHNKTEPHALSFGTELLDDAIIIAMAGMGGGTLLFALLINIKQALDRHRRRVDGHVSGAFLVHSSFFTYVQVIMCILIIVQFIMAHTDASIESIYGVKAVMIPLALLSYLQIFLVVPYIDRFVIALQRMVVVLGKFAMIHVTVRLVFCLFLMNTDLQHPNSNFADFGDAMYGIFLLDLSEIQLEPPFYLQFTHLAFYYISGVLLINYLIAIMTDLAADVNNYGVIICDITKLDLAFQAQENFIRYIWRRTREPSSCLIIKVEQSKSMKLDEEATKTIDMDKYDTDY